MNLISRLRPVSFAWKQDGQPDMGFVAEEVAEVEPLLVTHNDDGAVEGVKYDRVGVVLVNAIKAHQAQIQKQQKQRMRQQEQNRKLEERLAALEALLGKISSHAAVEQE